MNSRPGIARSSAILLFASASALVAEDLAFVAVLKEQVFRQQDPAFVMLGEFGQPETGNPFLWETFAEGTAPDALVSGSVTLPGGTVLPLMPDSWSGGEWIVELEVATPRELDTARPDGTYLVSITTRHDGVKTFSLDLDSTTWPPAPRITNYSALQALNPAFDVPITWEPMGGTVNDYIRIEIEDPDTGDPVYQSGGPGMPGSLDGTATGVTVPGGLLQPGKRYEAEVYFVKITDMEVAVTFGVAGVMKTLGFPIRTNPLAGQSYGASVMHVSPGDGVGDVPRDSSIAFRFDAPMSPGYIDVTWTANGQPLSGASFTTLWVNNNTQLQFRPVGLLPAGTEITWEIDPDGFRDANGRLLVGGPFFGRFTTGFDDGAGEPDVQFVSVVKGRLWEQDGDLPVDTGLWGVELSVELSGFNRARSATLTTVANGRTGPLYPDSWDAELQREAIYGSKADLDRIFPNGGMTFTINARDDGTRTLALDLGSTDLYPVPPRITNLASLDGADASAPVTITWEALAGRTGALVPGGGWIGLGIEQEGGNEVWWVEDDQLESGTSAVIPVGVLASGRSYVATLEFVRITDVDTETYPGAMGVAGFITRTRFPIRMGGDVAMPTLQVALNGEGVTLSTAMIASGPARYRVETSQDLARWLPFRGFWLEGTWAEGDPDAGFFRRRFYRLVESRNGDIEWPPVTIEGVVLRNGSPVPGVVVGTSLDGRTTVTGPNGRFFLETETWGDYSSTPFEIWTRAGTVTTSQGFWNWGYGSRGQVFTLP